MTWDGIGVKLRKNYRPKKQITVEEWSRDFGAKLAYQVVTSMMDQRERVGPENFRMMVQTFVAGSLSAFINIIMREVPSDQNMYSQAELLKFSEDNFIDLKNRIQDAVASGFQAGIFSWSGQQIEYYTQIKPIPEPINKNPC